MSTLKTLVLISLAAGIGSPVAAGLSAHTDGHDSAPVRVLPLLDDPTCDNAIPENEDYYNTNPPGDLTNGGCNYTPYNVQEMTCGYSYCGTMFTFFNVVDGSDYRDLDWFHFNMPADGFVTFDGNCSADYLIAIAGGTCDAMSFPAIVSGIGLLSITNQFLTAGDYWFIIAPNGFTGLPTPMTWRVDVSGACTPPVDAVDTPVAFSLGRNMPNPFNPSTTISFTMDVTSDASLQVFDLSGRTVATLVDGMVEAGQHSVTFNAADLSSGVYLYSLEANGLIQTRKMVLVK